MHRFRARGVGQTGRQTDGRIASLLNDPGERRHHIKCSNPCVVSQVLYAAVEAVTHYVVWVFDLEV